MSDHAWMELCEVSSRALEAMEAKSTLEGVCLQLPSSRHKELTTAVFQAVPSLYHHQSGDHSVRLHPLLFEFLSSASEMDVSSDTVSSSDNVSVSIAPLPISDEYSGATALPQQQGWILSRVDAIVDLPPSCCVSLTFVYREEHSRTNSFNSFQRQVALALEGRLIRVNSVLASPTISGLYIMIVTDITRNDASSPLQEVVYRVTNSNNLQISIHDVGSPSTIDNAIQSKWEQDCSGYESMLDDLISISQLTGAAAPSGVLLTGCAGVGKSRLASCLAYHVTMTKSMHDCWISAQDLLVRASWSTEADLLELLIPKSPVGTRLLLVIDDLQILESDENDEESLTDPELLLVHNAILEALAQVSTTKPSPFILGITHVASRLPKGLIRIGRLEKNVVMNPPTQLQREDILKSILVDVDNDEKRQKWAETLASQTAGCVAADLCRMAASAWTTAWSRSPDRDIEIMWNDLRDAAQAIVPSQLAQLDVAKTESFPQDGEEPPDPHEVHEWSWRNFGGYEEVKKRLYRTVVMPWRLLIATTGRGSDGDQTQQIRKSWVTPPSGVLFHGPPGVGKTLAASCLASSLGLHVVKVRASDVLDQWLGGSEAAIRSLFSRARAASPCVLFFDEIDALANNREDDGASVDVSSRILTTFLNEMDGVSTGGDSDVLVVACTNRFERLDAALLRPGRLDEHVMLTMPDAADIREMMGIHLAKVPLSEDVNITELAELMMELDASGADVEGLCRDACSRVIRKSTELSSDISLSQDDFISVIREWRQ